MVDSAPVEVSDPVEQEKERVISYWLGESDWG